MVKSRVTEILGIEYPVLLGSMTWLTSARLCAAVSNAGGLGLLGSNAGQTELTSDIGETVERMKAEIEKTRTLTDKPFTVNYMLPDPSIPFTVTFAAPMLEMLLADEKLNIILCSGKLTNEGAADIKRLKEAGKIIIYRDALPVAGSFKRAEDCGVDIVIATGVECGGHLNDYRIGLMNMMQIAKEECTIPVVAAGGIVNADCVRAVYALGAEGVYIGTLFLIADEAPTSENTKQAIIDSDGSNVVEFRGMSGFMRCLKSDLVAECERMTYSGVSAEEITAKYSGGFRTGMLLGDHEKGIVSISAGVGQIKKRMFAAEIVAELVKGME